MVCGCGAESRRKVVSSRLGFAIRLPENFLCQSSSKWVTFFEPGKIRQRKERDGLRLSFAVPRTLIPLPLRLLGYGKPFT